jgi:hypothetical protein
MVAAAVIAVGGMSAIFFYTATVHAAFLLFVLYRMLVRAPLKQADREPFEPEPLQPAAPLHLAEAAAKD